MGFQHRGVVEGFYGPRYSHAERLALVERIGRWGMNRYVYAPKDDPLHRSEWRIPYPEEQRREFAELVAAGERAGVAVGFAVSPGLSIEYARAGDVADLVGKFAAFAGLGSRFLALTLDDVPTHLAHAGDREAFGSLGAAHVSLAHAVAESLPPDAHLWLVPTDYVGVEPTAYLEHLGAGLDPRIEVGWTGRTLVSPTIRADEAARRSATLRRPLLLWDNTPVADGPMRNLLHLGPYLGRDPQLDRHASGVLLNPMEHPRASGVTIRCAAEYLGEPRSYRPEPAWARTTDEIGAGAPEAFARFARAHRFSPLASDDRDTELEGAWSAVRDPLGAVGTDAGTPPPGLRAALSAWRDRLEERAEIAAVLRSRLEDRVLLGEIEPWIGSHAIETSRMRAAADALESWAVDAPRLQRVLAFLAMEGRLTRAEPSGPVSYGPRRVLYPQLVSMEDEGAGFGEDPALFRDRCLADDVVVAVEARLLAALTTRMPAKTP